MTASSADLPLYYGPEGAGERQRIAALLRDPRRYFAECRRWARARAKAEVRRELERAARRHR